MLVQPWDLVDLFLFLLWQPHWTCDQNGLKPEPFSHGSEKDPFSPLHNPSDLWFHLLISLWSPHCNQSAVWLRSVQRSTAGPILTQDPKTLSPDSGDHQCSCKVSLWLLPLTEPIQVRAPDKHLLHHITRTTCPVDLVTDNRHEDIPFHVTHSLDLPWF